MGLPAMRKIALYCVLLVVGLNLVLPIALFSGVGYWIITAVMILAAAIWLYRASIGVQVESAGTDEVGEEWNAPPDIA